MALSPAFRHDWTAKEIYSLLTQPLDSLLAHAREVHREHADNDVQKCTLLSVKTGACPENCGYCAQSARFHTGLEAEKLWDVARVKEVAEKAKQEGSTRFCLGAAWRSIPSDQRFDRILEMIREVAKQDMEVCCTLGMATKEQLEAMKDAGLTAYNHNLDTSREHYPNVVTTRTYDDRLQTLQAARQAGVQLCCGGILGLGESIQDRAELLRELSTMNPHPESVPINLLVPVEGTPMENQVQVPFEEFLRTIAVARILMPHSRVRLSAGRNTLTEAQQLECFEVGANSIFLGEKLLTVDNVEVARDLELERVLRDRNAATVPA